MKKKRHGKHKKSKKVSVPIEEPLEDKLAPHSFVITRGIRNRNVQHICRDLRRVMEPYTATHLKERRCNKIKDFLALSGIFHVSHMCIFTQSETALSLKIARMPKGPTLTFKVHQYTLMKDVLSSMKTQFFEEDCYHHAPVIILNGFTGGDGKHLKLMATTFQNMFPAINLSTVKLSNIKRCVLFSHNPVTKLIDIRHYYIKPQPVGINKGVKKLVQRQIPDLSNFEDVSEFVTKADLLSGSEFEDDEKTVVMPQSTGKGNMKENKSSIKLYEIGPRFTIQLIKIEEELMGGEVFFHEYVVKTEEEVAATKARRDKRKRLKEQRKQKMKQDIEAKQAKLKKNDKKVIEKDEDVDFEEEEDAENEDESMQTDEEIDAE